MRIHCDYCGGDHSETNCPDELRKQLAAKDAELREARKLLADFYATWDMCESSHGCYSLIPSHTGRCERNREIQDAKDNGTGVCTCGRDVLIVEMVRVASYIDEHPEPKGGTA
jgi:hypothetical protein